jgi:transmembrane sensor
MDTKKAAELLQKYKNGTITKEEEAILDTWYLKMANEESVASDHRQMEEKLDKVWGSLQVNQHILKVKRNNFIIKLSAAAVLLITFGAAIYLYSDGPKQQVGSAIRMPIVQNDVRPGGNKAILVLSNGQEIILDTAKNGQLTISNGVKISKMADGRLLYSVNAENSSPEISFNTIKTPKGGQYQVLLPDGTNVWINAGSSLRFPTQFAGNQRRVELQGEAYFEVAKNKLKPFKVVSNGQEIEVLGTHFNVNAYANENGTKTTLFEGAVKLNSDNGKSTMLIPGEEAILTDQFAVTPAKGEEAMAWKNGMFQFENASINQIMRQIERWYDVDVTFEGQPTKDLFRGKVQRKANLSEVLRILELSGIKFDVKGRKITVWQ